jgi:hypothetical protein
MTEKIELELTEALASHANADGNTFNCHCMLGIIYYADGWRPLRMMCEPCFLLRLLEQEELNAV